VVRSPTVVWCFCIGVLSLGTNAYTDEPETLKIGTRLRITAPSQLPKPLVGSLTAVDASVLVVDSSKQVRRDVIQKLEVSERRSWKKKGALIGAGAGVLAAAFLSAITNEEDLISPGEAFAVGLVLFTPVGAGLGALIAPGESWVPVQALAPVAATHRHGSGRVLVALRIRF
jgi:hypothetical protein